MFVLGELIAFEGKAPLISNSGLSMNVVVTTSELVQPILLAVTLIVQSLVIVNGPLYNVAVSSLIL